MRTYLIDSDSNEHIIALLRTIKHSSELVEFVYSTVQESKEANEKSVFIRKLAGQYFVSFDKTQWKKLARQDLPTIMLNVDTVYNVYRGYKPSGLAGTSETELLTQMPGKVVKILVKEGEKVSPGDTLVVLEAMKMENEIKSAINGVVKKIYVKEEQALDQGVLMMEVDPT